jgi:hypothetical protein
LWLARKDLNGRRGHPDAGREVRPASVRGPKNSSERGAVVLDPFAGSGSTLIACETSGRRGRAIELDPRYVDVVIRRWQAYTGGTAVLEQGGLGFNEIASGRRLDAAA